MPNYCYNHMTINTNNEADFDKLLEFFNKYNEYDYFAHWCNTLLHQDEQYDPEDNKQELFYDYGTRWWDFQIEHSRTHLGNFDGTINVYGDSAWAPPLGLAELISKTFDCEVEIEFSEPGMNFAGKYYYANGNLREQNDYEYNEFQYLEIDNDYAIENIKDLIKDGVYEDVNDLLSNISYMKNEDIEYLIDVFNKIEV